MTVMRQEPDTYVSKVCSSVAGSVFAVSVLLLTNNAVSVNNNYDVFQQTVVQESNKTNVYKSFTSDSSITDGATGYTYIKNTSAGVDNMVINEEKIYNLQKLEQIEKLTENWNGNGAKAFSKNLIARVRELIIFLAMQPEVFPTACDSLQLEYDKADGSHLEIEIPEEGEAEIFSINSNGDEKISNVEVKVSLIDKVVKDFYG